MKRYFWFLQVLCLLLSATLGDIAFAEGSAEVGANQRVRSSTDFYVDIVDARTERIRWTGNGTLTVRSPAGNVVGVLLGAGLLDRTTIPLDTIGNGAYRVTMGSNQGNNSWDVEVTNQTVVGGRLYATQWNFDTNSFNSSASMNASFYALTPGGAPNSDAIMQVRFDGLSGYVYSIGMNADGIAGANSRSTPEAGNTFTPLYKLYVNPPSVSLGGALVPTLSNFQFAPANACSAAASGGDDGIFSFSSDADGKYKIICDLNKDGIFDISSNDDLLLSGDAVTGTNTVLWNATTEAGGLVASDTYSCQGFLTVGEVHFVGTDMETSYQGLRMFSYDRATAVRTGKPMFWNDTLLQGNALTMPNGQVGLETSGPNGLMSGIYADAAVANTNARAWGNFSSNSKGNDALLDTWGFAQSSNTQQVSIQILDPALDTDMDTLVDVDEICLYGTDPNDTDTDNDTIDDGVEVANGWDPLDPCDPIYGATCGITITITAPANNLLTNDNTQAVTGVTSPLLLVTLTVNGVVVGTTTSDINGNYTFTEAVVGALADGANVLVTSVSGTQSGSKTATVNITVDTIAPVVTLVTPANGLVTNLTSVPASGTTTPNTLVELFVDGVSVGTTTSDAAGAYSFTAAQTGVLTDGTHVFRAAVTDAAGNVGAATNTITVDTLDPLLTLVNPADGLVTNQTSHPAAGVTESLTDVELFVDGVSVGVTTSNAAGLYSFTAAQTGALMDGSHTFKAVATDAAGNTTEVTNTILVDTTEPTVVITAPALAATTPLTTTVTGTTEADATVTVTIDSGLPSEQVFNTTADANGDFSADVTVAEGPHTIDVLAVDPATNSATATSTFSAFAVALDLDTPADGSVVINDRPAISGTTEPGLTVTIVVDQGLASEETITATADGNGDFYLFPLVALADGMHTVTATVTDPISGAVVSKTNTFEVDAVGLGVAIVAPVQGATTNDSTPDITGTTVPNTLVTVVVNPGTADEETLTTTSDTNGDWTVTPTALADGSHEATASVSTLNGTISTASVNFVVDTMLEISILSPPTGAVVSAPVSVVGGQTEGMATVSVEIDGTTYVATVSPTGYWEVALTTPLGDGAHTVIATATDLAGNTATAQSTFDVDTTLPFVMISTPVPGSELNMTPTVVGQADANATVKILVDGVDSGTVTADANGDWTYDFPADLADGEYEVVAQVEDAGKTGEATTTFTIDTTIDLTVDSPVAGSTISNPNPVLTGVTDPGALVTVTQNGTTSTVVADGSGQWSVLLSAPFTADADGEFTVDVTATDAAGNTETVTHTFFVDDGAPGVRITTPDNAVTTNDPTIPIIGITEPNLAVVVVIDQGLPSEQTLTATSDANGFFTVTPAALADGRHTIKATATDAAGNIGVDNVEFIVDTRSPDLVILTPAEASVFASGPVTVTGSAEANAVIQVFVNGVALGSAQANANGEWSIEVPAETDGIYDIRARTTDTANNVAEDEVRFTIKSPSVVTIDQPLDGATLVSGDIAVTGTATPGEVVTISLDGTVVGTATADTNGDWTLSLTDVSEGPHTIVATGEDGGTDTVNVTVALNAPVVTITSPANGDTVGGTTTVTGTAGPGVDVDVYVDDVLVGTATADENGDWTFEIGPLEDGDHTVEGRTTDDLGREGSSGAVTFTVDTIPPVVTVLNPTPGGVYPTTPPITGTGEPGTTVIVTIDGGTPIETTVGADGTWSIDPGELGPGEHTITVKGRDEAGNESELETITFTIGDMLDYEIQGGCSTTPGFPDLSLLALGLAGLFFRRRKG